MNKKMHFCTHIFLHESLKVAIPTFEIRAKSEIEQRDWSKIYPMIQRALCLTPPDPIRVYTCLLEI